MATETANIQITEINEAPESDIDEFYSDDDDILLGEIQRQQQQQQQPVNQPQPPNPRKNQQPADKDSPASWDMKHWKEGDTNPVLSKIRQDL